MDDRHAFDGPDLAQLVGSRLCHDLVNPLSAISNGIELMALSGSARTAEVDLIAAAVGDAMARLRFFRIAFGAARDGESLSQREIRDLLADLYGSGRLSVDWQATGDLPRLEAKLAFLMLSCAETALPLGGQLTVSRTGNGWQVAGFGRKLVVDSDLWDRLHRPSDTLPPPSRVQFALLADLAAQRGCPIRIALEEDAASLALSVGV